MARIRAAYGELMGVIGWGQQIFDIAAVGYEAMTLGRRMTMRVSVAHGFGYWVFQDRLQIDQPSNPPDSFTVAHRESDRADREIGRRINDENFSRDRGLTSSDWDQTANLKPHTIQRAGSHITFPREERDSRRLERAARSIRRGLKSR